MEIAIICAVHFELVSSVYFWDLGHALVCIDIDPTKSTMLGAGKASIYELRLDALMIRNVAAV